MTGPACAACNIVSFPALDLRLTVEAAMRVLLATVMFVMAMFVDLRPAPARSTHHQRPWCVIENTGRANWLCYPTRALCRRFAERPGTSFYCVEYPLWSGRG
jgi:hypothetical protein